MFTGTVTVPFGATLRMLAKLKVGPTLFATAEMHSRGDWRARQVGRRESDPPVSLAFSAPSAGVMPAPSLSGHDQWVHQRVSRETAIGG